jgi:uncharacterized protein YmfQ (DUF2313 family)
VADCCQAQCLIKRDQISSAKLLSIGATVLDEVEEIIELPGFDAAIVRNQEEAESIELDNAVPSQRSFTMSTIQASQTPSSSKRTSILPVITRVRAWPRRTQSASPGMRSWTKG